MKLLVICGPTATGKTKAGITLAKEFNGEIISADSRQVYKGMNIGTGKDLPTYGDIPVWMLDIVKPDEQFSVAQYSKLARKALEDIWKRRKLPILIGGTGLYIKALVDGIDTLHVLPNAQLRKKYESKTAEELFSILHGISSEMAASLNASERKNKRRLIRKIELVMYDQENDDISIYHHRAAYMQNILFIGLIASSDVLKKRINNRIDEWIKRGAEDEVKKLILSGVSWNAQSMNAIGYREWKSYFDKKSTLDETIAEWKKNEWQYAKRQMTWFKRDKRIFWFDIENPNWAENVEKKIREWYNS